MILKIDSYLHFLIVISIVNGKEPEVNLLSRCVHSIYMLCDNGIYVLHTVIMQNRLNVGGCHV